MKGLIFHCRDFRFKDLEKSSKPLGISEVVSKEKFNQGSFKNRIVVFVCIEEGDTKREVEDARKHIIHMIDEWHGGNKDIILLPFGHLSKNLAKPEISKELIDSLSSLLRKGQKKVDLITFGTHKEWMIDVYGYPRATSWFQFPD